MLQVLYRLLVEPVDGTAFALCSGFRGEKKYKQNEIRKQILLFWFFCFHKLFAFSISFVSFII